MARIPNGVDFGSGFNISSTGPIDSRMRVEFESDLIDSTTFPAGEAPLYVGLTVTVMETGDIWVLRDVDKSDDKESGEGWIRIGGKISDDWAYIGVNSDDDENIPDDGPEDGGDDNGEGDNEDENEPNPDLGEV